MVAVNLAVTLAMTASSVLLVDADLRRPDIHTTLRVEPLPGLAEFLEARLDLLSAYRRVDPFGFYYMPAGHFTSKPVELLQSAKMHKFFKEATSEFDWVILDSPPLLPFADGHCLAALSDAVLLVVRDGFPTREEFQRSLTSLKDAYIAGVILNGADGLLNESYYSYYKVPATLTEPRVRNLTFGQFASK
jgi:Mrp family chromosome partitioning ATPase